MLSMRLIFDVAHQNVPNAAFQNTLSDEGVKAAEGPIFGAVYSSAFLRCHQLCPQVRDAHRELQINLLDWGDSRPRTEPSPSQNLLSLTFVVSSYVVHRDIDGRPALSPYKIILGVKLN
jgi:hypothetical protein